MQSKLLLGLFLAGSCFAQEVEEVVAHRVPEVKNTAPVKTPVNAPKIDTKHYWQVLAAAREAHLLLNETPQGKAAANADAAVAQEVQILTAACGAKHFPAIDTDSKSTTSGDVICKPNPEKEKK